VSPSDRREDEPRASVSLELVEPVPTEVPVGSEVAMQVRAASAAGNLRGGSVVVMAGEAVAASARLVEEREGGAQTAPFSVEAPHQVGAFTLMAVFPAQEIDGVGYGESTLPVTLRAKPHPTSLAVWAVPSPVTIAERFSVAAGVKSSGACALGGAKVEIRDAAGATIGDGTLGDVPWPGTDALYWTEITLTAPRTAGIVRWRAIFAASEVELPHDASSAEFSFTSVSPAEHRLTVEVVEGRSRMADVQVALGPYRATTDAAGVAYIEAPGGAYELAVWKPGFRAAPLSVDIAADASVQIELTPLPEEVEVWD
jgi:hypothetical protein